LNKIGLQRNFESIIVKFNEKEIISLELVITFYYSTYREPKQGT
jgi:hypothetical protein